MKTSTISSMSIHNALRYTMRNSQAELIKAQQEVSTGQYQDIGAVLGAKTTRNIDLNGEMLRIENLKSTNSIVTQRLSASQEALSAIAKSGQTILNSLVALAQNTDASSAKTTSDTVKAAFQSITSAANTSLNGEYLFSGINTDVKPLDDFYAPGGSTSKTAVTNALNTYLAAQTPALTSASDMSKTQMDDFITNTLTPMFTGPAWNTTWSSATDQNMTTRVNRNEVIETSTNTNSDGMRNMALASVLTTELLGLGLSNDVRQLVAEKATSAVGLAISGVNVQRTALGLSESRVSNANTSLDAQKTIIETHLSDLTGVDAFEASTRVANLKALVEAAYSMTAQLQQMSLVNFLK